MVALRPGRVEDEIHGGDWGATSAASRAIGLPLRRTSRPTLIDDLDPFGGETWALRLHAKLVQEVLQLLAKIVGGCGRLGRERIDDLNQPLRPVPEDDLREVIDHDLPLIAARKLHEPTVRLMTDLEVVWQLDVDRDVPRAERDAERRGVSRPLPALAHIMHLTPEHNAGSAN